MVVVGTGKLKVPTELAELTVEASHCLYFNQDNGMVSTAILPNVTLRLVKDRPLLDC